MEKNEIEFLKNYFMGGSNDFEIKVKNNNKQLIIKIPIIVSSDLDHLKENFKKNFGKNIYYIIMLQDETIWFYT